MRRNMSAQALIVGDDQLFPRLIVGDGGRKIAGWNVTDDRVSIPALDIDDCDGHWPGPGLHKPAHRR